MELNKVLNCLLLCWSISMISTVYNASGLGHPEEFLKPEMNNVYTNIFQGFGVLYESAHAYVHARSRILLLIY